MPNLFLDGGNGMEERPGPMLGNNGTQQRMATPRTPTHYQSERDRVPPPHPPLTRRQWILVILLTLLLLNKHFLSFLGSIENGNFSLLPTVTNTEQHKSYSANNNLPAPSLENNNQEAQPVKKKEYSWILIRSWPAARVKIDNRIINTPSPKIISISAGSQTLEFIPVNPDLESLKLNYFFGVDSNYVVSVNLETGFRKIKKIEKGDN